MADYGDGGNNVADPAALPPPGTSSGVGGEGYMRAEEPLDGGILRTRTYDVSMTYDKYYQTPRTWLVGYSESRAPLGPEQALEDVSVEHAKRTVMLDWHPHLSIMAASIHPCRHGAVMKKLADQLAEGGGGGDNSVERYFFIFLKFIASIVPTIEYDYTLSAK